MDHLMPINKSNQILFSLHLLRGSMVATILLFFVSANINGQQVSVVLSGKHQKKLNQISSGHERITKYHKYLRKDSLRQLRLIESRWRREYYKSITKRKMLPVKSELPSDKMNFDRWYLDSLEAQFCHAWVVLRDSSQSDSLKQLAVRRMRELVINRISIDDRFLQQLHYQRLKQDGVKWDEFGCQIPGVDSLAAIIAEDPSELFALAEKTADTKLEESIGSELSRTNELSGMAEQYASQLRPVDKDSLREVGFAMIKQSAARHFASHSAKLPAAQDKVSKLLSKYKEFSNAEDLSTAVKRTSMNGKTIWEHLLIGGNFNIVSTSPFSIDFSPQLGYKFTTQFSVGIGINYRYTYADSIRYRCYISPTNTALKAFVNYDIVKGFYAYAEWEKSGIESNAKETAHKEWRDNYFVGAGRKFLVHPKLYLTATAMYNLNGEDNNPVHPKRFQVRIGFQVSELATRKKKVYYDRR